MLIQSIKSKLLFFLFPLLFLNFSSALAEKSITLNLNQLEYQLIYQQFSQGLDNNVQVADVNSLILEREYGKIFLKKGKVYLLNKVNGRHISAIFKGEGTFQFDAPTKVEKEQLKRIYKQEQLTTDITHIFLVFSDHTLEQLHKFCTFTALSEPFPKEFLKSFLHHITYDERSSVFPPIMQQALNNKKAGYFFAYLKTKEGLKTKPDFIFEVDPDSREEVHLYDTKGSSFISEKMNLISSFHTRAEYQRGPIPRENKNILYVKKYDIETHIDENLHIKGKTTLHFNLLRDKSPWLNFHLFYSMYVDSVVNEKGQKLAFYKSYRDFQAISKNTTDESNQLWIKDTSHVKAGQSGSYTVHYRANKLLLRDNDAWVYLRSSLFWIPKYAPMEKAFYRMKFIYPDNWHVIGVGEKISSDEEDDFITDIWETPQKIRNASFNVGYYKDYTFEIDDDTEIKIYKARAGHTFSGGSMEEDIAQDIRESYKFYEEVFGPLNYKEIIVTETPYRHGLAHPGMLHLSWTTFVDNNQRGYDHTFRAHEMAHQWWGIDVDFDSYHDQWLSEAFSEYSAMWYYQTLYKDMDNFFDMLNEYKKEIEGHRDYTFGEKTQSGPIWLGTRTASSYTEGDYSLVIYKKGAWVLHMLRMMMINLRTMDEKPFMALMKEFATTYKGKKASTEDFKMMVSKYFRADMGWFFDQWVYGATYPTINYEYDVNKNAQGKYDLILQIRVENVESNFQMPMPFQIEFEGGQKARLRKILKPGMNAFKIALPLDVDDLEFNYLSAVLAEIKEGL